jgi:hypothetical protein
MNSRLNPMRPAASPERLPSSERTNFPREVCEQALAHTIKDKTEAAYRRSDLFERRRDLMAAWERTDTEKIVSIRA